MSARLLLALAYDAVLVMICLYAFARGGRPERFGAAIMLAASFGSSALRLLGVVPYAPAEIIVFSVDIVVMASLYCLAIRTSRFWPVWAFGFAVANMLASIAAALLRKPPLFAYYSSLGIYAYLALVALAIGTYRLPRDATPDQRRGRRPQWDAPTKN